MDTAYDAIIVGRAAPVRRRRCSWLGRDTVCWSSTARRSRVTRYPRTSSTRGRCGSRPVGTARPADGNRLSPIHAHLRLRSLHDLRIAKAPRTRLSPIARVERCSTRYSSTPRRRRRRGSRRLHRRGARDRQRSGLSASRAMQRAAAGWSNRPGSSWELMAAIPWWRPRSSPEQSLNERPPLLAAYYTIGAIFRWTGGSTRASALTADSPAAPTHDSRRSRLAAGPMRSSRPTRRTSRAAFPRKCSSSAPAFAGRVRGATRAAPFAGAAVPNFLQSRSGPGWALIGDAGYATGPDHGPGHHRRIS